MFSISGIVHFRSKAFESTILKICRKLVPKMSGRDNAYLLDVDAVARTAKD
jgi:hypothetical protein